MQYFSRVDTLTVREEKSMVGDFGQSGGVTNLAMLKVIGSIGPVPATDLAGDNFGVGGEADFGDITCKICLHFWQNYWRTFLLYKETVKIRKAF